MPVMITLNQIKNNQRKVKPCKDGWTKLLKGLGKTESDDEPFPLVSILETNGLDDANWCVDCLRGHDREVYNYRADIAERVLHIFEKERPNDTRVRDSIAAMRAFADGKITARAMSRTQDAAEAAERATVGDAAKAAAGAAVGNRECHTLCDSALYAVWFAPEGGASFEAADVAECAERAKQVEMFSKWFG